MKIKRFAINMLRNNSYFQYMTEFKKLLELLIVLVPALAPLHQKFLLLYNKMDAALKKIVKSVYTEPIKEADKARDETWEGLVETNKAALKHFDPAIRESARRVKIVIDSYGKSKLARLPMMDQTSAITNIVQDLEGAYAQQVRIVGLVPLVIELKARNITFANLVRDRVDEKNSKDKTGMKEARKELDKVHDEIIEQVSARVVVEGLAAYEEFIGKLNIIIDQFKLLIPKRSKKDNEEVEETPQP